MASPESHIIILTTNRIEELNKALIRAGRISQKVPSYLAGPNIGYEMFLRFIQDDGQVSSEELTGWVRSADSMSQQEKESQRLCELAASFAEQIPNQVYSPAEIQDYLLIQIDDSEGAVNDFNAWKEHMTAEYEAARQKKI